MRLEEILRSMVGKEVTIIYKAYENSDVFNAKGILVDVNDDYIAIRFRERKRNFIRLLNRRAVVITELIFEEAGERNEKV